jgi:hypothetical protein
MKPNLLLEAARIYRAAGLSVVPNKVETKYPPITWTPHKERLATDEEMRSWWPKWDGIGLVCGKVSGNLELIDFDNKGGRDIALVFQEWRKLLEEEAPGLFDRLTIVRTQRQGFHVPFRCPGVETPGNLKLARIKNGSAEVLTLIETRGEGGQFLTVPSPGYRLMAGDVSRIPEITARERELMLQAARSFNEYVEPSKIPQGPVDQKRSTRPAGNNGKSPGDDYNERADLPGLLTKHGWTFVKRNGDKDHWRRPGKSKGQSASVLGGQIFYVFSGNAHPFEPERSYDAFGVYALLEHGGDFTAAARELGKQGYGTRERSAQKCADLQFPDIMAGVAGDFAKLYSSYLEVPAHFLYMAFLTCLGTVVADRLTLASEIVPQPRLFVVLLGESADDRKSTAISKTVEFFRAVEPFPVCFGVGSAEGLQKRLESSNRLLLCFDEFRQFISKCKIEASVLLPCVNTLFESNRYESRTKQSDIFLDNAYLSLLAASTVQTYENTWSAQFTDIGFNNRLFLVPGGAERMFSLPAKVPDDKRYLLRQRLAEVLRHVGERRELDLTHEARDLFHAWYMDRPNSIHSKRLDTYALRFMSLLAVNELRPEVDEEITRKVISLCDWQYQARLLHDPVDADNEVARMEEKIRRVLAGRGDLTERDLKKAVHTERKGVWFYSTAKRNLQSSGELGFNKKEGRYFLRRDY